MLLLSIPSLPWRVDVIIARIGDTIVARHTVVGRRLLNYAPFAIRSMGCKPNIATTTASLERSLQFQYHTCLCLLHQPHTLPMSWCFALDQLNINAGSYRTQRHGVRVFIQGV